MLKKLIVNQVFTGQIIDLQSANILLQDLFRTSQSAVTIADIKKEVGNFFGVNLKDLDSACRSRKFARPRQVAMYLSKVFTTKSLPDIGSCFGGKNHATVIHAFKNVEKLMLQDVAFAGYVKNIAEKLSR